jgi:DNA end-binding protein Ku
MPGRRRKPLPERDDTEATPVRPLWTGTLSFGLVSVPVELYTANRANPVSLRMLDSDGTPLARRYFCPQHKRALDSDEIVRGYEVEDGEFVVVTDDELESAEPEKSGDIDLKLFADVNDIDPLFFERAYFLAPAGKSSKVYRLLAETMEKTGHAGIATFVMRDRQYLVAILAENGILRAETMRFVDEVRSPEEVGLPEKGTAKSAQVQKIEREMSKLTKRALDVAELRDDRAEQLLDLVMRKQAEGRDVVEAEVTAETDDRATVIDLMAELKKRMQGAEAREQPSRRTTTTRKRAAPKRSSQTAAKRPAQARKRKAS